MIRDVCPKRNLGQWNHMSRRDAHDMPFIGDGAELADSFDSLKSALCVMVRYLFKSGWSMQCQLYFPDRYWFVGVNLGYRNAMSSMLISIVCKFMLRPRDPESGQRLLMQDRVAPNKLIPVHWNYSIDIPVGEIFNYALGGYHYLGKFYEYVENYLVQNNIRTDLYEFNVPQ
jgi:hypothetical protein